MLWWRGEWRSRLAFLPSWHGTLGRRSWCGQSCIRKVTEGLRKFRRFVRRPERASASISHSPKRGTRIEIPKLGCFLLGISRNSAAWLQVFRLIAVRNHASQDIYWDLIYNFPEPEILKESVFTHEVATSHLIKVY